MRYLCSPFEIRELKGKVDEQKESIIRNSRNEPIHGSF